MPFPLTISIVSTVFLLTAFVLVNYEIPDPYLDEIFHIPQAQRYCRYDYTWDDSITTPPGLYLLSALPLRSFHIPCSPLLLRLTNFILAILIRYPISQLLSLHRHSHTIGSRSQLRPPTSSSSWSSRLAIWEQSSVIASFPLIFFFGSLYYTDVFSTICVVGCYALGKSGKPWLAGLVGMISLTARQTNVVWIGFTLALSLRLEGTYDPPISLGPTVIPSSIFSVSSAALRQPVKAILRMIPYFPSLIGFTAFIVWNGGIVLGHKDQHKPVPHLPQVLYFIAFTSVLLLPSLFAEGPVRTVRGALRVGLGGLTHILLSLVALAGMLFAIHNFTMFHPFLLADNRHYVFYVLRRILIPYPMAKYALAPVYLFASWAWLWRLRHSVTALWLIAFLGCTTAVLVPSPLIEPRYFLIPTLILRLEMSSNAPILLPATQLSSSQSNLSRFDAIKKMEHENGKVEKLAVDDSLHSNVANALWIEFGWYSLINIATTALFLSVKFKWEGWEGWMRFMW